MKRLLQPLAVLALVAVAAIIVRNLLWPPLPTVPPGELREITPTATAFLPTLDDAIPAGKSAIWCASFPMAWQRLKDDVIKAPIRLDGSQDLADRLNAADGFADAVEPADVYAAAGRTQDGIVATIRDEMARRFPGRPVPDLDTGEGVVAFAYLRASVAFARPFIEVESPLAFSASDGKVTKVKSFGLPSRVARPRAVEDQVEVLHVGGERFDPIKAYVLDLSKHSRPYQLLVARIPRKATLGDSVADVERRIAEPRDPDRAGPMRFLDAMEVPHVRIAATYRFAKLEGRKIENTGDEIGRAVQRIEFRLDAAGASLTSEAAMLAKGDPRKFYVAGPFLLVMRKRGGGKPFFAAWVENAEVLERWE